MTTKVFDLEFDLPIDEQGESRSPGGAALREHHELEQSGPLRLGPRPGYGYANYSTIFRSHKGEAAKTGPSLSEYVAKAREAGVERALLRARSNDQTADFVEQHPDFFVGMAFIHPLDGMRGVFELERVVKERGLRALAVSAFYSGLPASDARVYPLYAKCVELGIPVRIYTAMSYANDRPYDLGHPRHVDRVAIDFPELRIVAGLGGWPWAGEMAAILRRHPNLYVDTSAHRARYFAQPGSGWDEFLHFGNTVNQDKVMVGLSAQLVGGDFGLLVSEYEALPLKETVKRKWLYENAVRFFSQES